MYGHNNKPKENHIVHKSWELIALRKSILFQKKKMTTDFMFGFVLEKRRYFSCINMLKWCV